MTLRIEPTGERTAFAPGDTISGRVHWTCDEAPAWLELRLFWYTEGKGTQDVGVAAQERFSDPGTGGERPFSFRAPALPLSCSGRLVSIRWALELVGGDDVPRVEVVIGPGAREIVLGHVE